MALAGTALVNFKGDYNSLLSGAKGAGSRAGGDAGSQFGGAFTKGISGKFSGLRSLFSKEGRGAGAKYAEGAADEFGGVFKRDVNGKLRNSRGQFVDEGKKAGGLFGKSSGQSAGKSFLSTYQKIAGAAVVVGGIKLFGDFVSEARESAKVSRITENAIRVTGGAANVTADQISNLSTAISNKTGIDDEQIQTASNLLLTFKNVRNEAGKGSDIFNRATQGAADLSVQFGGIDGASKQLGKALQDPVKGISALGRAGVTFSADQKDQIANFVKTGDLLSAQKIILGEVETQVGGAAEAAADPMQKLGVIVGNLKERVGTALLPVIDKASKFLGDNLPRALDFASDAFGKLVGFLKGIKDAVGPVFGAIVNFVKSNPTPVFVGLGIAAGVLAIAMTSIAISTNAALIPVYAIAIAVGALVGGVIYAYQNFETFHNVVDAVWQGVQTVIDFAWNSVIKPVFFALAGFVTNILIPTAITLWNTAVTVFEAVSAAVSFAWNSVIKPVFSALSSFVTGFLIPAFNLISAVGQFVFTLLWSVVRDMWEIVRPIFSAVVGFIGDQLLPGVRLVADVAAVVFSAVSGAVSAAWDKVRPVFEAIVSFISDKLAPVWSTVSDAVSTAFGAIPGAISSALRTAGNIVAGFMRGVAGIADTIGLDNIAGALRSGASKADGWGEGGGTAQKNVAPNRAQGYAAGGFISGGTPGKDSVPAMLMPGEVVIRKAMVDRFGARNLLALNAGAVPKFGLGGFVDGVKNGVSGGLDFVKGLAGDLVGALRKIAAGELEKLWPEMAVSAGLLGLPAGGLNFARSGIIDLIRGDAKKKLDAENAKEKAPGATGLSGLAATNGLNPEFLSRFNAWNAALGGKYRIGSGYRSYAQQVVLYQKYLNGTGNLAARPGSSNHNRGLAIDTSPRVSGADQAFARQFKLHFPVRGEPWHVEPFARGGYVHPKSFDSGGILKPGWNHVRNDTGADEPLVRPASGPMIHIDQVNEPVTVDILQQKLSAQYRAGSFA